MWINESCQEKIIEWYWAEQLFHLVPLSIQASGTADP